MEDRIFIEEIYIDCQEDEIILVKKIDELLHRIKKNRERIVCIIADEDRTILKLRGNDEQKK